MKREHYMVERGRQLQYSLHRAGNCKWWIKSTNVCTMGPADDYPCFTDYRKCPLEEADR